MPRQRGYYTLAMDRLRSEFGGVCVHCGSGDSLEFAHLRPTKLSGRGRGLSARVHDIRRYRKRYTLLCTTHHRLFDSGYIRLEILT